MLHRITAMRTLLRNKLESRNNGRKWSHITDQIGMFCYTGLTKEQVIYFRLKFSLLKLFMNTIRCNVYKKNFIFIVLKMVDFQWQELTPLISITWPILCWRFSKYFVKLQLFVSSFILYKRKIKMNIKNRK